MCLVSDADFVSLTMKDEDYQIESQQKTLLQTQEQLLQLNSVFDGSDSPELFFGMIEMTQASVDDDDACDDDDGDDVRGDDDDGDDDGDDDVYDGKFDDDEE